MNLIKGEVIHEIRQPAAVVLLSKTDAIVWRKLRMEMWYPVSDTVELRVRNFTVRKLEE